MRYHPFLYDKETYPLDINAYTGTYINLRMKQCFFTRNSFSTVNITLSHFSIDESENIFNYQQPTRFYFLCWTYLLLLHLLLLLLFGTVKRLICHIKFSFNLLN